MPHSSAWDIIGLMPAKSAKSGFTLVEFLIVLGILAIAVGGSLLFLTSVLRGSNQANVNAEVKQNGQTVLDTLDSQIRNAKDASSDGSSKYIMLTRNDDDPLHIKCFSDSSPKSANGWIGTVVSASANPSDFSYTPVTNQDLVSGVDINSCDFRVLVKTAGAASPAVVSIAFFASQGIGAPSRQDFVASVKFQTTISLRQY